MIAKLTRWLIFSVVVALLPLVVNLLSLATRGRTPSFSLVSSHGELLLVSAAIAAGGIGELFGSSANYRTRKITAGGGCVIVFFISSFWFADLSSTAAMGITINTHVVSSGSLILFLLTVVSTASCVALSEY